MNHAPQLKMIGYWIDSLESDLLPPQLLISQTPLSDQTQILHHLNHAQLYETYRGSSWCRFQCAEDLGTREFSDGLWVWPEGLAHYVENHNIILPQEFIEHVRAKTPPVAKLNWNPAPPDLTFWRAWSQGYATPLYRQRLLDFRQIAQVESQRLIAVEIHNIELKEGLSERSCLTLNCKNRALAHRDICGGCSLHDKTFITLSVAARALSEMLKSMHRSPTRN